MEFKFDIFALLGLVSFAVQIAAGVAPVRWPNCKWLAGVIFWGACFVLFGSVFFWLYSNTGIAMAMAQPTTFILIGLLIATGGAAWEVGRSKPLTPTQADQHQASPPTTAVPSTQPIVWEHYKTPEHKVRISEALHQLSEILNKPIAKIERDSQGLIQYWEGVKLNPDRRPELKNILSQLGGLQVEAAEADTKFRALMSEYQGYGDLWRVVLQMPSVERERPLPRWQYARNDFHKALTTYESVYGNVDSGTREGLAEIVNPTRDIFRNAVGYLNSWIAESNKRAEAERAKIFK